MHRNSCNKLYCIEEFKCCSMGTYNGRSFKESPDIKIKILDQDEELKECKINARDTSPQSTSYSCKKSTDYNNRLQLEPIEFKIEDKTEPSNVQPKRVKNFSPVICSPHSKDYTCSKTLSATIEKKSSLKIKTGFEMGIKIGAKVKVEGLVAKAEFSTEVSAKSSFSVESSREKTTKVTDKTEVKVDVPAGQQVMIDLLRKKVDIVYKWKGTFRLLGKYQLVWSSGDQTTQDITSALTGSHRDMHSFGYWEYPETDVLQVVITDRFGGRRKCQHTTGTNTASCRANFVP